MSIESNPNSKIINLTYNAVTKAKSLIKKEEDSNLRLRISVKPGGCSGLMYEFYFDDNITTGDIVENYDGLEVIIDKMSIPYLSGATIDFSDTIKKQGFTINNPSAKGTCACGDSFH